MRYTYVLAMTLMLAASQRSFAGDTSPVGSFDSRGTPYRGAQIQLITPGLEPESNANSISSSGVAYRLLPSADGAATAQKRSVSLASVNRLVRMLRCPAGDSNNPDCNDISRWIPLQSATAYYRDVIIAASTTINDATNGETWSVTFTQPGGNRIEVDSVSFNDNCFRSSRWFVCGSNSIEIVWYFSSQCTETGTWRVDAFNNGSTFAFDTFVVKPQLGTPAEIAAKLTPYRQRNYSDNLDNVCHSPGVLDPSDIHTCSAPDDVPWTIAQQGCGIATFASMLSYFGVSVDPPTLNKWLIDNKKFKKNGALDPRAIAAYARSRGVEVSFVRVDENPDNLTANICTYGPVPIRVRKNTHQVTATGRDDDLSTYTVLDPWDGANKTLRSRFNNRFTQQYVYSGPERHFVDPTGLNFTFHSPVEVFVIDPLGRRQGLDPRTGEIYDEIPNAYYGSFDLMGPVDLDAPEPEFPPLHSPKALDINMPIEGEYTLNVIGTATGTYSADFTAYDINLDSSEAGVSDVPTALGAMNVYQITFEKAAGSQIQVAGGFNGGGQRPRDVNRFLTYTSPSQTGTSLPTGTSSHLLQIVYGSSIIPSSFNAKLNGVDITTSFNPAPGSGESVVINLQQGRNVLLLSIDGDLPNRVATDTDRLVFDVQ